MSPLPWPCQPNGRRTLSKDFLYGELANATRTFGVTRMPGNMKANAIDPGGLVNHTSRPQQAEAKCQGRL